MCVVMIYESTADRLHLSAPTACNTYTLLTVVLYFYVLISWGPTEGKQTEYNKKY